MTKKAAIIAIDIRSGAELTGKKNVSEAKIADKKKRGCGNNLFGAARMVNCLCPQC